MADELVKRLRSMATQTDNPCTGHPLFTQAADAIARLSADYKTCSGKFWDLQQRYADVNNQVTEAQSTIARLTAERDAAWKEMKDQARIAEMSAGLMRDPQRTGSWVGAERTACAFDRIARMLRRALSPSTLNKPE